MLYKVDVYNSVIGTEVNNNDKVDYIIVTIENEKVKEVVSDREVFETVNGKLLEKDYEKIIKYRKQLGVLPCIKSEDLVEKNLIHYNESKGYNPELTEYVITYNDRFFTKFNRSRGNLKKEQKEENKTLVKKS